VLEVEPVTWLEVRDTKPTKVVTGYMHQSLGIAPLDREHPDNLRLKKAGELVLALAGSPELRVALADFHTARREAGAYLAFYANRALEDVGYYFGTTKKDHPDWDAMNAELGTSKAKWERLTKSGETARHEGALASAKLGDRDTLLGLAHEALKLVFEKRKVAK
jgi:hypothetical protein